MHHILVWLGIDDVSGPWYAFWSGFGSDLTEFAIVAALVAAVHKHNCHVKGCRRVIRTHRDDEIGRYACGRHHTKRELHGTDPHAA